MLEIDGARAREQRRKRSDSRPEHRADGLILDVGAAAPRADDVRNREIRALDHLGIDAPDLGVQHVGAHLSHDEERAQEKEKQDEECRDEPDQQIGDHQLAPNAPEKLRSQPGDAPDQKADGVAPESDRRDRGQPRGPRRKDRSQKPGESEDAEDLSSARPQEEPRQAPLRLRQSRPRHMRIGSHELHLIEKTYSGLRHYSTSGRRTQPLPL